MKSSALLLAVLCSLGGGIAGGAAVYFVAGMSPNDVSGRVAVAPQSPETSDGVVQDGEDLTGDLEAMKKRIDQLESDLVTAERERRALLDDVDSPQPDAGAAPDSGNETERKPTPVEVDSPEFKAAVDSAVKDALERARKKEEEEWTAAAEAETERWMEEGKKKLLATLDEKLSLTQYQRDRIGEIYDKMTAQTNGMDEAARKAREAGESYDWEKEWEKIDEEAETALRAELGSAQISTYEELVGDGGFSQLLWPDWE